MKQEVLNMGIKTGTKIFSKGITIAKFGLNFLKGSTKEQEASSNDDGSSESSASGATANDHDSTPGL